MVVGFRLHAMSTVPEVTNSIGPGNSTTQNSADSAARVQAKAPSQPPALPPSPPPLTDVHWPQQGQAAVMINGSIAGKSGQMTPVSIASLTKMMTAVVVLKKLPLSPGQDGPTYTVTPQDVHVYNRDHAQNDSAVKVVAGEQLTERQMLEGLLLPSGDNIAVMLANWVSGSEAAFVQQMNTEAAQLGMNQTQYADTAGVSPSTVSTAVDQLRVASAAMQSPVIREIVNTQSTPFPVVGQIHNTNVDLGHDGIVGLKTGNLRYIGNMAVAANRTYQDKQVLVIGVVLEQPGKDYSDSLLNALAAGKTLIQSVGSE